MIIVCKIMLGDEVLCEGYGPTQAVAATAAIGVLEQLGPEYLEEELAWWFVRVYEEKQAHVLPDYDPDRLQERLDEIAARPSVLEGISPLSKFSVVGD